MTSATTIISISGLDHTACPSRCLRFAQCIAASGRKTRFRLEATLGRAGLDTSRVPLRSFRFLDLPLLPGFAWRTDQKQSISEPTPQPSHAVPSARSLTPAGWEESAGFRE